MALIRELGKKKDRRIIDEVEEFAKYTRKAEAKAMIEEQAETIRHQNQTIRELLEYIGTI